MHGPGQAAKKRLVLRRPRGPKRLESRLTVKVLEQVFVTECLAQAKLDNHLLVAKFEAPNGLKAPLSKLIQGLRKPIGRRELSNEWSSVGMCASQRQIGPPRCIRIVQTDRVDLDHEAIVCPNANDVGQFLRRIRRGVDLGPVVGSEVIALIRWTLSNFDVAHREHGCLDLVCPRLRHLVSPFQFLVGTVLFGI